MDLSSFLLQQFVNAIFLGSIYLPMVSCLRPGHLSGSSS